MNAKNIIELREHLAEKYKTKGRLAIILNVSQSRASRVFRGKELPKEDLTIKRYAEAININFEQLKLIFRNADKDLEEAYSKRKKDIDLAVSNYKITFKQARSLRKRFDRRNYRDFILSDRLVKLERILKIREKKAENQRIKQDIKTQQKQKSVRPTDICR